MFMIQRVSSFCVASMPHKTTTGKALKRATSERTRCPCPNYHAIPHYESRQSSQYSTLTTRIKGKAGEVCVTNSNMGGTNHHCAPQENRCRWYLQRTVYQT